MQNGGMQMRPVMMGKPVTLGKPNVGVSSLGKAFIPVIRKNPQLSKMFGQGTSGYLQFNPLAQSHPSAMNDYGMGSFNWGGSGMSNYGTGMMGGGTGMMGGGTGMMGGGTGMMGGGTGMMMGGGTGMMGGGTGMMGGGTGIMMGGGTGVNNMGGTGMMMMQPLMMGSSGGGLSKVSGDVTQREAFTAVRFVFSASLNSLFLPSLLPSFIII